MLHGRVGDALTLLSLMIAISAPVWQLHTTESSFGAVTVHGTTAPEQASGHRFSIAAKPDGSLPLIRGNLGGSGGIVLYKRLDSGSYALYCDWSSIDSEGDGLLLEPGDYLYQAADGGIDEVGSAILGGEWMSASSQLTYLAVKTGDSAYTPVTLLNGATSQGLRFLVKLRADAKMPVITQNVNSAINTQYGVGLFKRDTRTSFSIALRWRPATSPAFQGAMLGQGEYVVEVRGTTRPATYFEHAIFFTGHFK